MLAGERIRAGLGWSTALPSLDWETYSEAGFVWNATKQKWERPANAREYGLDTVGAKNYVNHPTFAPLSLAYNLLDNYGARLWVPPDDLGHISIDSRHPWPLIEHVKAGRPLKAWNLGFEWLVWMDFCVPRWGWPPLNELQVMCAMAQARAHAYPGKLKHASTVLKLVHQKDEAGEKLLDKFSYPRNPTKKDPRTRIRLSEDVVDAPKLLAYNVTDVLAEHEAAMRCPDLQPDELAIWRVDQRINRRGIGVDLVAMENCISIVLQAHEKYNAELASLTNGVVTAASQTEKLQGWVAGQGVHLYDMKEATVTAALERKDLPAGAKRALWIRSALGSAAVKKLFAFKHQNYKGRLYDLYAYFAAKTGRWNGMGPQPMNLYKGRFKSVAEVEKALACIAHRVLELVEFEYGDALECVASCLRGLLVAAPGHELICSDFSAIEGVVTAALAGEEWRLEVFRTHGMIYEASASMISGVPFAEFVAHKQRTGLHHPLRAGLGKYAELASGFKGWIPAWKRFGADKHLSDDEIKKAILKWRNASPMIVELWGGQTRGRFENQRPELHGLEGASIAAVMYPGNAYAYRGIVFQVHDDILFCQPPSSGLLTYHKPRLTPSQRFEWSPRWEVALTYEGWNTNPEAGPIGWVRMELHGGKETENVVQKEARKIQAVALIALDDSGYNPILHSHDEICGEVPVGGVRAYSVEEFEAIVAQSKPAFAATWPIRMKGGWRGPRYGKFD